MPEGVEHHHRSGYKVSGVAPVKSDMLSEMKRRVETLGERIFSAL